MKKTITRVLEREQKEAVKEKELRYYKYQVEQFKKDLEHLYAQAKLRYIGAYYGYKRYSRIIKNAPKRDILKEFNKEKQLEYYHIYITVSHSLIGMEKILGIKDEDSINNQYSILEV